LIAPAPVGLKRSHDLCGGEDGNDPRGGHRSRLMLRWGSVAIFFIALFWLVQRLFG
jgi:hypothetical protein